MSNRILAFDESGNTGSDLMNYDQPIFVLSSVYLSLEEAKELKSLIKTTANELKFNSLKKYGKYHSQIINLLNHPLISEDTLRIFTLHKDYSVIVHTVDRLIEPQAYKEGLDLYEEGMNIALTNMLFYCTPAFCDKSIFEKYKVAFVNLFRQRTKESIIKFYDIVGKLILSSKNENFKTDLVPILRSSEVIHQILATYNPFMFDAALTGFVLLADFWGRKINKKFDVFVDNSKPLSHFKDYIDIIKSDELFEQTLGYDRRTLQLPLKIKSLEFVDSKENEVVQIADLIAGAANHAFKSLANNAFEDELSKKLTNTKLMDLLHSPVWPHMAVTPKEMGTDTGKINNLVDKMTDILNNGSEKMSDVD